MESGNLEVLILLGVLSCVLAPPVISSFLITAKEDSKKSFGYLLLSLYAMSWTAFSLWYLYSGGSNSTSGIFAAFTFLGAVMAFNRYLSYR